MLHLWLAPGIHLTEIDDDLVVLDVPNDRYNCIVGAASDLRLGDDGDILVMTPDAGQVLEDAGLVMRSRPGLASAGLTRPARDLPDAGAMSGRDILRAGLVLTAAGLSFRGRTLAELIVPERISAGGAAPRHPRPEPQIDLQRYADVASAARRARVWVPYEGECLKRAFQLRRLLARHGLAADWVFGVKTWPFAAHCWLQVGDVVVGDRLERVRMYTPIMRA